MKYLYTMLAALVLVLAGCQDQGPAEETGEWFDDTFTEGPAEERGEEIDESVEEAVGDDDDEWFDN